MDVAIMLVDGLAGTVDGGMYCRFIVDDVTIVPHAGAHAVVVPAVTNCHVTPSLSVSLATVASSTGLVSWPAMTDEIGFVIVTATAGMAIVKVTVADLVGSVMDVAVTETAGLSGTEAGAV